MKRKLAMVGSLLMILGLGVNAQEKFTTYDNTYIGKPFEIDISIQENNQFNLYIYALSLDAIHETGGFLVSDKNYLGFINALTAAKSKYVEWIQTAKANNVTELDKLIPASCRLAGYFMYGNDWQFQFLVNPTFNFKIIERNGSIEYLLLVRTGELESSSNQFMDVDGFVLAFTSEKEIQTFLDSISMDKIKEFMNKPKVEDLFK